MKYSAHILQIKLWEWEGVKEKSNMSITVNGPNSFDCENLETAQKRINELQDAIRVIDRHLLVPNL